MKKQNWNKWLTVVFLLAVIWELFIFIRLPKQAFIQGLLESWFVSKGLIFYKDFGGYYFPFLRMLMVPLHEIFGYNQNTTIFLAPATSVTTLALLYYSSLRLITGWAKLIPIIFYITWHTFLSNNHFVSTTFLGVTVLASVILWLSWWEKPSKAKSFLLGLFTAFSVYTLQIVLPFYILLHLPLLAKFNKLKISKRLYYLLISFSGFLLPSLVIVLWFYSKGALYELYRDTIQYHFTNYPYSNLGRGLENTLVYLSIHLPVILYLIANLKKSQSIFLSLACIVLPLTFWLAIFHPLRFEISLPVFALIFGFAVQNTFISKTFKLRKTCLALLIMILAINIFTITKYKFTSYREKLFETEYPHAIISEVYSGDPMYSAIDWMRLNSTLQDKIFVLGDALFYPESDRLPANRRAVASEPFVYVPFEEFKDEIENSWPAFWVIDERQWNRMDDFGYKELRLNFQQLVETDPVVAKFEYWTIRKH